jgi:Peptidase M50B-like
MPLAFEKGYLRVGEIRGAPICLHWSIPVAALVLGRFRFAPWYWAAFVAIVLVHELGHAVMVWTARAEVIAIEAHGAGGLCHWQGEVTRIWSALIAWGGVLAQAVLLGATYAVLAITGPPASVAGAELADAFTGSNLWLIAINLIPIPGFDGSAAWPLFPLLLGRWRERRSARRRRKATVDRARAHLAAQDHLAKLDDALEGAEPEADALLERVFGPKERKKSKHDH